MENIITNSNSSAIKPLIALLRSLNQKTQENSIINMSINDNKAEITIAGAIEPLMDVF
jgi:hypothetical protein